MAQDVRELIYIADPMCSWCWGFVPVIESIAEEYAGRIRIQPLAGGLRPGTSEPLKPAMRETILHHWREVHKATGQPFCFDFKFRDDFVYDTEPPCRGVVTMRGLDESKTITYFHALHEAFYVENRDITQESVLTELAVSFGVEADAFAARFNDPETKQETWADFEISRKLGISGFPAAVMCNGDERKLLTYGYLPFEDLKPRIDAWLEE